MKKCWMVLAVLLAGTVWAAAEDLEIQSVHESGRLTFNEIPDASEYRVEWAPRLGGAWTNRWTALNGISAEGSGTVTVFVPMVYRVVATIGPPAGFALVPAGTFLMGSPTNELGRSSNETQHQVTLTHGFFLQQTEVTNQQMAQVLNWALGQGKVNVSASTVWNLEGDQQALLTLVHGNGNVQVSYNGSAFVVEPGKENYPCFYVNWYGAQAYCNYLSDMEGLARAVSLNDWSVNSNARGYRLPTESEWEYACRAGRRTAFYTGDITQIGYDPIDPNLDLAGWYWGNSTNSDNPMFVGQGTHPVGLKQANDWHLFDMHGNAYEWCSDWYGSYPGAVTDPAGPAFGTVRVFRGGSWRNSAQHCRSAYRQSNPPDLHNYNLGFRPVRTAVP